MNYTLDSCHYKQLSVILPTTIIMPTPICLLTIKWCHFADSTKKVS